MAGAEKSSGAQFRDGVAAEEPFFGERAVAVVDGHFGGRVGFGPSNGLGDCLFTARTSTPWVMFFFLGHCPTLLGRMNTINVASKHHRFPASYRIHPPTARLGGVFLGRDPQVVSEKNRRRRQPTPVRLRVANPRQGDFAKPDCEY